MFLQSVSLILRPILQTIEPTNGRENTTSLAKVITSDVFTNTAGH